MNPTNRILIFLLLSLSATPCLGFGHMAHRVICQAAYDMLDRSHRAGIDKLIHAIPISHIKVLNKYQWRSADSVIHFAESCVWPDAVKKTTGYLGTQTWHYINVQRDDQRVEMDDCMAGCLLSALDLHLRILKDESDAWTRVQALMFVGHWVADLHQPMHVSFADDRGGNETKIEGYGDSCFSLHRAWDYCILEREGSGEKELVRQLQGQRLADTGTSIQDFILWANESLALSRDPRLKYCSLSEGLCLPVKQGSMIQLDEAYQTMAVSILRKRMEVATALLAGLLQKVL